MRITHSYVETKRSFGTFHTRTKINYHLARLGWHTDNDRGVQTSIHDSQNPSRYCVDRERWMTNAAIHPKLHKLRCYDAKHERTETNRLDRVDSIHWSGIRNVIGCDAMTTVMCVVWVCARLRIHRRRRHAVRVYVFVCMVMGKKQRAQAKDKKSHTDEVILSANTRMYSITFHCV